MPKKSIYKRLEEYKVVVGECHRSSKATNFSGKSQIWYNNQYISMPRLVIHLSDPEKYPLKGNWQANHKNECKYKDCFRLEHLYAGTQGENRSDCTEAHDYERTH
jgi:hypothetical protein